MSKVPAKKKPSAAPDSEVLDPLEQALDSQIGDLVPQGARSTVVARIASIVMREQFSGPIAHPRHLREYEQIVPGSADRIIRMAEEQQHHHRSMDEKIVEAETRDRTLGMWLGGACFLFLITCALATAVITDSEIIPGLFLGTAAIGGVGLFVKGRNGSSK